jgi:PAS domain S-box-containing protein
MERILLVEDDAEIANITARTLCGLGYEFMGPAWSAEEAIRTARKRKPSLVLMDIGLRGGMDGIEAARRIRHDQDIPIVFLTAAGDDQTLARAKMVQPFGYIVKPFEPTNLHMAIEIALTQHQAGRKHAEEALAQAEANFQLKFQNAVAGMFQAGNDGELLQANRTMARLLGYESPDDLTGTVKNLGEVLNVDRSLVPALAIFCQHPGTKKKFELQAYRKDGSTIWVSGSARAVRGSSGEILCYEGSVMDTMNRRKEPAATD